MKWLKSITSSSVRTFALISAKMVMLACAIAFVMGPLLRLTAAGNFLRETIELSLDFKYRAALGREPEVSPRLKILVFDDPASEMLGAGEIPLTSLAKVLAAIEEKSPSSILVPKNFSFGSDDPEVISAFRALRSDHVTTAAGAFLAPLQIGARAALTLDRPEFDLEKYAVSKERGHGLTANSAVTEGILYGPHSSVIEAFSKIGHTGYLGGGLYEPFLRVGPNRIVPHLAMFAAGDMRVDRGSMIVDGVTIPSNAGRSVINFLSPQNLRKRSFSLRSVFKMMDQGVPLKGLEAIRLLLFHRILLVEANSLTRRWADCAALISSHLR